MLPMKTQDQPSPTPVNYRHRSEVATFWSMAVKIRRGLITPEAADVQITTYVSTMRHKISAWLEEKLDELRELNKKRFK